MVLDQVDIKRVEFEAVKNKDILDKVREILNKEWIDDTKV